MRIATTLTQATLALAFAAGLFWPAGRTALWGVAGLASFAAAAAVHLRYRRLGEFDTVEYGVWEGEEAGRLARRDTALLSLVGAGLLTLAVALSRSPTLLSWLRP